jgi:hypothetical protein
MRTIFLGRGAEAKVTLGNHLIIAPDSIRISRLAEPALKII